LCLDNDFGSDNVKITLKIIKTNESGPAKSGVGPEEVVLAKSEGPASSVTIG